jgi:DNA repair protein RAD7
LTDFLATNNISARQIQQDYRVRQEQLARDDEAARAAEASADASDEEKAEDEATKKKRKRKQNEAIAKIKKSKDFKKAKKSLEGGPGEDDDDEIAWDMYTKSKPLPGQLENCEKCGKRFTVTGYSKAGPEGGLLCSKCSKELDAEKKKDAKPKKPAVSREKRRHIQSDLLHGIVRNGSKSLVDLCVEKVAANIHDVEEFGDVPPSLLNRFSQIMSKNRILTPRTLPLLLRPDLDSVAIYDCGKLETADFISIFQIAQNVSDVNLRCAGQFKDECLDFLLSQNIPIKHLQLEAANLVSEEKWVDFFSRVPSSLESLKLSWLDFAFNDETLAHMVRSCPQLKRLKLKKCFRLTKASIECLGELKQLEHLSLDFAHPVPAASLVMLIRALGPNLRTLSLERFTDADDSVLSAIHDCCTHLSKLRFSDNDCCTDAAYTALFTHWANPPLTQIDLSSSRDVNYSAPDGPADAPIGLASDGFRALMAHSGARLEIINIHSCRHISHGAFAQVWDGRKQYALVREMDLSFLDKVDTAVIAGVLKSCPGMQKLAVFGCFEVKDVKLPPNVALIGPPTAMDEIVVGDQGAAL